MPAPLRKATARLAEQELPYQSIDNMVPIDSIYRRRRVGRKLMCDDRCRDPQDRRRNGAKREDQMHRCANITPPSTGHSHPDEIGDRTFIAVDRADVMFAIREWHAASLDKLAA